MASATRLRLAYFAPIVLQLATLCSRAQPSADRTHIFIDAANPVGVYHPVWNYFGADEPNYSYAPGGTLLLQELAAIDPATPVWFRPHNLLTTGDGSGSLKWGSTNVYTETPEGAPIYNWAITDRLFDNLRDSHIRPFVEIGFMPEALSPHPQPYRQAFGKAGGDVFTGWSYPPTDYGKWRALIVAWVQHLRQRYGAAVDSWQWEVWNEPDIPYFHGTPEEYLKLYDVTTAAVRQVLPHALVGGPAVTGGGENKHFLQLFLEHCARGINADSHQTGAPLDFISFHPKGSPKFIEAAGADAAHVRMNLGRQLAATDRGFQTIAGFPRYRNTPIILSETDPEGCAACQGPQNGYRNGTLYAVSVAEMLVRSAELARLRGVNLAGAVTWAFEFEDQPYFAGFRELASDGPEGLIDKPVLNVFRLFGKLSGQRLALTSSAAMPATTIAQGSVTAAPDIDGIATRSDQSVDILLWNYHDDDLPASAANLSVELTNLPGKTLHLTQYRVDHDHSNAYTAWQALGSPQHLTRAQFGQLTGQSKLQTFETRTLPNTSTVTLTTTLPRQGVTLYHLTWQ